ncbi:hypothetical protein PRNP1_014523 [Phytophthora ramorum]
MRNPPFAGTVTQRFMPSPPLSELEYVPPEYYGHYVSVSEPFASTSMLNHRQGEDRDEDGDIVAETLGGASVSVERLSAISGSVGVSSSKGVVVAETLGGASDPFKDEGRYSHPIWMEGVKLILFG